MSRWIRVFALSDLEPDPEVLRAALLPHAPGLNISRHDGPRGWERLELTWPGCAELGGLGGPLFIDRFHRDEEGIRGELLAWAAWLETVEGNPHVERLMEQLVRTQWVITIRGEPSPSLAAAAARVLAKELDGVCQVDGVGFENASGEVLVREESE